MTNSKIVINSKLLKDVVTSFPGIGGEAFTITLERNNPRFFTTTTVDGQIVTFVYNPLFDGVIVYYL